jgi:hypothetical protein
LEPELALSVKVPVDEVQPEATPPGSSFTEFVPQFPVVGLANVSPTQICVLAVMLDTVIVVSLELTFDESAMVVPAVPLTAEGYDVAPAPENTVFAGSELELYGGLYK